MLRGYPRGRDPRAPITVIRHRAASSLDDLRAAGALMARPWRAGSPLAFATPAGIEWWYASTWPDPLEDHLRLWSDGDELVAWSWHDVGEVEWMVWTGQPARDIAMTEAILEDALAAAANGALGVWTDEGDAAALALLTRHGFAAKGRRLSQWQRRPHDGSLAPAALPDGYVVRGLRGPDEFAARVEAHRAAFAPSKLVVEKYERLGELPHYRFDDDLVVEAPDGSIAAFAISWWDEDGRVGEFEPVGTHPDHRRRGLSRAVLTHGLRRLFGRGADVVQVYSDASDPGPEALYASAGFQRHAHHQRYERPAPGDLESAP